METDDLEFEINPKMETNDFSIYVTVQQKRSFQLPFNKEYLINLLGELDHNELNNHGLTPGWQDQPMTKEHLQNINDALENLIYMDDYDLVVNDNYSFDYDHSFLKPSFYVGEDPHDLNT